jgi:ABC-type antimicrobial peptide transport system permease subunit
MAATLRVDSTGSIGRTRRAALRDGLVVSPVALSIVLLIVAGLFVGTLRRLRPADFRVAADRVLLFTMKPQREIYTPDRVRRLVAEVLERTVSLPGVQSAALAENGPLGSPIFNTKTLALRIEDSLARERMIANISATFGAVALLLTGIGLYGILAYAVSRRTREIGIRVALGSTTRSVLWLVAREAIVLVSSGIAVGTVGGGLAARLLSARLVVVSPVAVKTLAAASGAMLVIAAIAVSVPAYRASRVDPTIALRAE